jgi:hypothetical protein
VRIFVEESFPGEALAAILVILVRGGLQVDSPCGSQFRIRRFSAKIIKYHQNGVVPIFTLYSKGQG